MAQNYSAFFTLTDAGGEKSSLTINTTPISDATLPGVISQLQALETAINGMTAGPVNEFGLTLRFRDNTTAAGRREQKMLVTYVDTTEWLNSPTNTIPNLGHMKKFSVEVPCWSEAKVAKLAGTDIFDPDDAQVIAFTSAFEAVARSPYGGAVDIITIVDVGRNS